MIQFYQSHAIILIQLLIAHVLVDFFLQPASWVTEKREKGFRSSAFYKHAFVVAVSTLIALPHHLIVVIIITATHMLLDLLKVRFDKNEQLGFFITEQFIHVAVSVIAWLYIISGWNEIATLTISIWSSTKVTTILLGCFLCIGPSSHLVKFATKNLTSEKGDNVKSGGRLIGIFERVIIYTLVLLSQYEAIGFLITGKSILRFADSQKKETEYVLVGTMLSYALAIIIGVGVKLLVQI